VSRRLLVVLVALGMLATGGGVAVGLLLARDPGPTTPAAGPTTIPETTAPPTSRPATPSSSSTSSSGTSSTTATTADLSVQARVVDRLEDGVVVGYEATEPVSAVLLWGFGGPGEQQLPFPGPATQGTLKLSLTETVRTVALQVAGRSADGRTGSSDTMTARRLARRVVLEVRDLTLDIPVGTTGGIATSFRGSTVTPLGPGLSGPTVSAEPYAFPSSVLGAGTRSGPLTLRISHNVPPEPSRTRVVDLTVPFPAEGQATLERDVSAIGLTAHLRLRVTVTAS
jgi:hypothetical protein